jgi:hypothetical protein
LVLDIERKRAVNERKFPHWEELATGGRKYWYETVGKFGFKARYVKGVDGREETTRFYQEIYDSRGSLVEVHEKFPIDLGHQRIKGGEK